MRNPEFWQFARIRDFLFCDIGGKNRLPLVNKKQDESSFWLLLESIYLGQNKMAMQRFLRFERKNQPLLPHAHYVNRVFANVILGFGLLALFLFIGTFGYHVFCGFGWLDSLLNASMILSGMGPTNPIETDAGKWFASFYALISGIVFITTIGIILAPIAHRVFHRFHLEEEEQP